MKQNNTYLLLKGFNLSLVFPESLLIVSMKVISCSLLPLMYCLHIIQLDLQFTQFGVADVQLCLQV